MGTRSMTIILDGNKELVRFYRQFDGYPEGLGVELAELANVRLCNGIGMEQNKGKWANGMGCLAAQIIAGLKDGIGNLYIDADREEISDWVEYVYTVRDINNTVQMQCTTQTGPWPFNVQDKERHVFTGTPAQFLKKYKKKTTAA